MQIVINKLIVTAYDRGHKTQFGKSAVVNSANCPLWLKSGRLGQQAGGDRRAQQGALAKVRGLGEQGFQLRSIHLTGIDFQVGAGFFAHQGHFGHAGLGLQAFQKLAALLGIQRGRQG